LTANLFLSFNFHNQNIMTIALLKPKYATKEEKQRFTTFYVTLEPALPLKLYCKFLSICLSHLLAH